MNAGARGRGCPRSSWLPRMTSYDRHEKSNESDPIGDGSVAVKATMVCMASSSRDKSVQQGVIHPCHIYEVNDMAITSLGGGPLDDARAAVGWIGYE
jgi:hypothetical protein